MENGPSGQQRNETTARTAQEATERNVGRKSDRRMEKEAVSGTRTAAPNVLASDMPLRIPRSINYNSGG